MITAPYNFVPLNKEVFYPPWADKVSHDIPFSDGESGEIEITVEAKSPIFIRNHSKDKENPSEEFCHFVNKDGAKEFYIPGSSIKGMIRSVLEIMSFGKIRVDEDKLKKTLGVRDMTQNFLSAKATGKTDNLKFGYGVLNKTDNGYKLVDYGNKIRLILQKDIKSMKKFKEYNGNQKDVSKKYAIIAPFSKIKVKPDENNNPSKKGFFDKYVVKPDTNGEEGELFFGGHFGRKHYEFVLLPSDRQRVNKTYEFNKNDNIMKNFKSIYFENDDKENFVGKFWKDKDKIPVFYLKSNNNNIKAVGLTQVFKLAYNKTLFDAIDQDIDKSKADLPETIFGYVKDKKALKGRVQFSHLKSTDIVNDNNTKEVEQVLGEPKPTYYPNYIKQTELNGTKVNRYKTLMDKDVVIRGYKRYPLQNTIQNYPLPKDDKGKVNHDVTTKFKPLDKGTTFKGKIRFHNLKKVEVGALISALTFHGKEDKLYHNIGMAKPLGYGKIKVNLAFTSLNHSKEEYLKTFEDLMNSWIDKPYENWKNSLQLNELFAMSDKDKAKSLRYQLLENPKPKYELHKRKPEKNDFVGAKKAREFLQPYTRYGEQETSSNNQNKKKESNKQKSNEKSKTNEPQHTQQPNGISKNKMKKAITNYWKIKYGIFFHPNQIKEFFSEEGFKTTPSEQQDVYNKLKDDKNFIDLLKMVEMFFENKMSEELKIKLYKKLEQVL